ncbi:MAG: hypothetical protein R2860_10195 [Desulfobacterales bacterium]
MKNQPGKAAGNLGGRAAVSEVRLDSISPVVVKQYTREGFIRHSIIPSISNFHDTEVSRNTNSLVSRHHEGPCSRADCVCLSGKFFLPRLDRDPGNTKRPFLIDINRKNPETASALMHELKRQVDILVENQIHHVDLHPETCWQTIRTRFILDFDKAGPPRTGPG